MHKAFLYYHIMCARALNDGCASSAHPSLFDYDQYNISVNPILVILKSAQTLTGLKCVLLVL